MASRVSIDAAPKRLMPCFMRVPPTYPLKNGASRAPLTLLLREELVNTAVRHEPRLTTVLRRVCVPERRAIAVKSTESRESFEFQINTDHSLKTVAVMAVTRLIDERGLLTSYPSR